MFDELDFYLSQRTSEYRSGLLHETAAYCFEVMGTPLIDRLSVMINSGVDLASDVAVDEVSSFLLECCVTSLAEFGVVLEPDAILSENLSVYNDILSTLLIADQYEDPHRLLALVEDVDDTEEALAVVVEEITGQAVENVLDVLGKVDCDLIARIRDENAAHAVSLESQHDDSTAQLTRLGAIDRLKHSDYYSRAGFVESHLVGSGLFGAEPYILLESMRPDIEDVPTDDLPTICYQICCASNVPTNAVIGTAKQLSERLLSEDRAVERQKVAYLLNRYPIPAVEL